MSRWAGPYTMKIRRITTGRAWRACSICAYAVPADLAAAYGRARHGHAVARVRLLERAGEYDPSDAVSGGRRQQFDRQQFDRRGQVRAERGKDSVKTAVPGHVAGEVQDDVGVHGPHQIIAETRFLEIGVPPARRALPFAAWGPRDRVHCRTGFHQPATQVGADEPGGTGDEDPSLGCVCAATALQEAGFRRRTGIRQTGPHTSGVGRERSGTPRPAPRCRSATRPDRRCRANCGLRRRD